MTTSWNDVPLAMSTAVAAQILGVGVNTVRQWLIEGRLRGERVGERKWIVPRASLIEFLGDDFTERDTPPAGSGPGDSDNDRPSIPTHREEGVDRWPR